MRGIAPFRVMQILARARRMEAQGRDLVHMEIGEPDFTSPQPVIDAAIRAQSAGLTHYTPAAGLPALRQAIADYYARRFGLDLDPQRVIVTPGASGALQLVLGVLIEPGDRVLMPDPGYPCNRHMVTLFGGHPVPMPVVAPSFEITPDALSAALQPATRALMLASPANPTGGLLGLERLRALHARLGDVWLICDEIYQGLQYDSPVETALTLAADNVVVINSFSKYFGMTGWRVGWAVVPESLVEALDRLAQNIFLAAPTPSQYAAVAAFGDASLAILESRRAVFQRRRDVLYQALRDLGFGLGPSPGGAFYIYADASGFTDDAVELCNRLLEQGGVALTPGIDFGDYRATQHVRFAYTTEQARIETGVERIRAFLAAGG